MNWDSLQFDWNQARAVLATVETGSLSAAARALKIAQPTVGRQVAALEAALGTVIFERVGRGLELTPAGAELVTHLQSMRDAALNLTLSASGQSQIAEGLVRITASDIYAVHVLPAFVAHLADIAPKISVEIIAANDIQDLQRREADIAIRHVRPTEEELVAKLVRTATAYFYASSAYFTAHGTPLALADLTTHRFIGTGDIPRMLEYYHAIGLPVGAENFYHASDNGLATWEMAKRGLGIAPMTVGLASQCPDMQAILPKQIKVTFPVWLAVHKELRTSRKIRLVYDALSDFIASTDIA